MRQLLAFSALALSAATIPLPVASAEAATVLTVCESAGCVQPSSNVLFQGSAVGNPIFGVLNNVAGASVRFSSDESLTGTLSNGQARISGTDGTLTTLTFGIDGFTFSEVEFNINAIANGVATVTFATALGDYVYNISQNGQNYLGAFGAPITSVTITTNPGGIIGDVRQVRLGGIAAVPEPAVWAMMVGGFGLVGGVIRRRAKAVRVQFA
jgi:hypothetical protein